MFDDYIQKLHDLEENVPLVLKQTATKGALYFEGEAKKNTNKAKAVDTGAYKRGWTGESESTKDKHVITMFNNVEYASYLEEGYTIHKKHFVPFNKMQDTPKSKRLIANFKAKNPKAKGFIAKPRRFKGLFIGKISVKETREWIGKQLKKVIRNAEKMV